MDPHCGHDFAAIKITGQTYFFEVDYYAWTWMAGRKTRRIRLLTILARRRILAHQIRTEN